ncbi:MAG: carboxypeptidase-like regulatory domain-containing protein [Acidobacteriaceae bacterium]
MKRFRIGSALILSLCVSSAFAQNTNSGDIRGTATDASGAVVPGVTVSVTDVDKGVTTTYVTDSSGLYDTNSIVPDRYTITFTKDGFTTFVRGPVTLQVGTITINGHLTVGATTQTVTVNTNVPLLSTETAAQSTTLPAKTMRNLPEVGAGWLQFVVLMPGTSGHPGNTANPGQTASVDGNLPYPAFLADGAEVTLPASQNTIPVDFESIAEVKMDASGFSAQYGIGGMQYNQISKGGTDHFHGVGYEYFQNNALNAAPYDFGHVAKVPILRFNNFGGTIGGPIWKKKMFFFFDYDYTSQHGGASNGFITVPTAAMRAGDFTGQPTIYDPTTQTVDASGIVHRQSFASEYGNGNKIPALMIDTVANAAQAYYPAPNLTGTVVNGQTTNNFFYNVPNTSTVSRYFGRVDYDINSANRLTMTDFQVDNPQNTFGEGFCPIDCEGIDTDANNAQISDVWTIRPDTTNEARMGFAYALVAYTPYTLNQGFPAKLGWKFAKANNFPGISVTGACCFGLDTAYAPNAVYKQAIFDPSDVVTMIRGKHVLHFGGEFLATQANLTNWGNINAGTMQYSGVYTASTQGTANTTGVPYADFLLGQTSGWSAEVTPEWGSRLKSPQLFVEDDIKFRPNLTVNLGLRWQGMSGLTEAHGNERIFDPTVTNPANNTLGAMWYGTTKANGRGRLIAPAWGTFLPRLGFSYQPRDNTVIRGGFGLFAYTWAIGAYGDGMGAAFGSQGNDYDATNGVNPVVLLDSDGNTNYQGPGGASINSLYIPASTNPAAFNGQGVQYNLFHTPVPKIYQWNLSTQRELGSNMVFELAYVASHGFNLNFPNDINQVPVGKLSPTDASGATNARPYPLYHSITGNAKGGISNYNSLQASIQRRFVSGLEFNFNYTWSHFMDTQDSAGGGGAGGSQLYQNSYVQSANYGNSNFDTPSMLKGQIIYMLPVGKGRTFLSNNYVLDQIVGGWQTAATVIAQSGNPFTPIMENNLTYSQAGEQFPNLVGNPHSGPHGTTAEWFNVAAYAQPTNGTFGNVHRNSLFGPGLTELNASLGKTFPVWRNVLLEIRADATNALNHPSFANPDPYIGPGHTAQIRGVSVGGRAMQLYGRISF